MDVLLTIRRIPERGLTFEFLVAGDQINEAHRTQGRSVRRNVYGTSFTTRSSRAASAPVTARRATPYLMCSSLLAPIDACIKDISLNSITRLVHNSRIVSTRHARGATSRYYSIPTPITSLVIPSTVTLH